MVLFIVFPLARKPLFTGWFFVCKNILKKYKNIFKKVLTNRNRFVIIEPTKKEKGYLK